MIPAAPKSRSTWEREIRKVIDCRDYGNFGGGGRPNTASTDLPKLSSALSAPVKPSSAKPTGMPDGDSPAGTDREGVPATLELWALRPTVAK
jgi:hypothetical protein